MRGGREGNMIVIVRTVRIQYKEAQLVKLREGRRGKGKRGNMIEIEQNRVCTVF